MSDSAAKDAEPRGWVIRLGSYLRIFGKPATGTMGYLTDAPTGQLDRLIAKAKEREDEQAADGQSGNAAWRQGLLVNPVRCRRYPTGGARFYVVEGTERRVERLVADTYFVEATDRLIDALDAEVDDA